jgi:hypothetical protein
MGVGEVYAGEDVEDLVSRSARATPAACRDQEALAHRRRVGRALHVEIPGTEPIDESMLVAPMCPSTGPWLDRASARRVWPVRRR